MNRDMLPLERIWDNKVVTETGCWEWQGAKTKGYGMIGHGRRSDPGTRVKQVHRVAWELTYGPIPEGTSVLHSCDNPPCYNPTHLFLGTQADNVADMTAKGRGVVVLSNLRPGAGAGKSPRDPLTGRYYKKETP
jgi:hypothetical protein